MPTHSYVLCEYWRDRVNSAETRYQDARRTAQEASETLEPTAATTYRIALRNEAEALGRYLSVLHAFGKLIQDDELPSESSRSRHP